jgi:hypothetical protein
MGSKFELGLTPQEETHYIRAFDQLPLPVRTSSLIAFNQTEFLAILPLLENPKDRIIFEAVIQHRLQFALQSLALLGQPLPSSRKENMSIGELREYVHQRENRENAGKTLAVLQERIFKHQKQLADLFGLDQEPRDPFRSPKSIGKEIVIETLQKLIEMVAK